MNPHLLESYLIDSGTNKRAIIERVNREWTGETNFDPRVQLSPQTAQEINQADSLLTSLITPPTERAAGERIHDIWAQIVYCYAIDYILQGLGYKATLVPAQLDFNNSHEIDPRDRVDFIISLIEKDGVLGPLISVDFKNSFDHRQNGGYRIHDILNCPIFKISPYPNMPKRENKMRYENEQRSKYASIIHQYAHLGTYNDDFLQFVCRDLVERLIHYISFATRHPNPSYRDNADEVSILKSLLESSRYYTK